MRKLYKCVLVVAMLLLIQLGLQAQGTLGLYTTSVSNSSPAMGEQFSLFTKLVNTSTTDTFKGVIDFELANEGGIINDIAVFGEPAVSGNFLTLAPLQEINLLFSITPQPSYFVVGPDIIIVWPLASAPVIDSARAQIFIQEPTGIKNAEQLTLKNWVQNQQLIIQLLNTENSLQRVQIFSTSGTLLISESTNGNTTNIPIGMLPNGIYIAEIVTSDGSRNCIKFIY